MRPSKPRANNPTPAPGIGEIDEDAVRKLDEDLRDALLPDDDYEPLPEYGDFWTDQ
jgi:hypothetical protein